MKYTFGLISKIGALVVAVLVLFTGPQAQAAGACGSTALAHRGAWTHRIDENTTRAIDRAHRLRAYTENDVWLTADGHFLIIHNRSLRPTTNCTGDVANRRFSYIRQHCRTTPNHMRIPTALEAFRTLRHNHGQLMNLEVKGPGWFQNGNAKLKGISRAARQTGVLGRVYFSNDTGYRILTALKHSAPHARTAWKPDGHERHFTIAHARRLSANAVMAKPRQWSSKAKVHRFKRAGFKAWASVNNNHRTWKRNWQRGIGAQLTGHPRDYRQWCNRIG
ncbi:MAG TPA: glycerophosphodiester phosphodiesterase [Nocardioidaceae bacterium]|nr:glycerophosphodiester phosphodiesterase [Nocardioidaceae bacterium]